MSFTIVYSLLIFIAYIATLIKKLCKYLYIWLHPYIPRIQCLLKSGCKCAGASCRKGMLSSEDSDIKRMSSWEDWDS
jgi:hypothetical protein